MAGAKKINLALFVVVCDDFIVRNYFSFFNMIFVSYGSSCFSKFGQCVLYLMTRKASN